VPWIPDDSGSGNVVVADEPPESPALHTIFIDTGAGSGFLLPDGTRDD
jgi:hypothetical protein